MVYYIYLYTFVNIYVYIYVYVYIYIYVYWPKANYAATYATYTYGSGVAMHPETLQYKF